MKKRTWIILISVLLAVAIVATAAVLLITGLSGDETENTEIALYWNVEQLMYEDPTSGRTKRAADDNGTYRILMATEGQQVNLTCNNEELVDKIDSQKIVGLDVDQNGQILQVYTLDELGYGKSAWGFYVQSVAEDGTVTALSSKALQGEQTQVVLSDSVKCFYVASADMLSGMVTDVRELDRIMCVTNPEGVVTHVFVIGRTYTGTGEVRYCEHCKQDVKWWSWDYDSTLPEVNGHFYLTSDVQLNKQSLVRANQEIIIDLAGYTVTGKYNYRVFATWGEGAYLGIMDSSAAQTGKIVASGPRMDQGDCLWIRYGTVELYGGTLDASSAITVKNGAGVLLKSGATFNMYGGTIRGGTSLTTLNDAGKAINGCGGNMYIEGNFNMYGGQIIGGRAVGHVDGSGSLMGIGGNLYVTKTGVVNITGGVIENGESTGPGANIYTNGIINIKGDVSILGGVADGPAKNGGSICVTALGTLNMEGGLISGGSTVSGSGGNLCTSGTVNLVGATIQDGTAGKYAASIYALGGVLHIEDCTVTHCLRVGKKVDFSLAGTVDIQKLELPAEALVNVDALETDSKIKITASGFFTEATQNNCASCFQPDGYIGQTLYAQNRLTVGYYRCVCGHEEHESWCDGKARLWKAWVEKGALPSKGDCFYLTGTVELTNQCVIRENQKVTLDLRGHTVYGKSGLRIFATWGEGAYLGVLDSSKNQTGKLVARGEKMDQGGCFWIRFGTVDLFSGTLDVTKAKTIKNGAAVLLKEGATFNMYGGTIQGGTSLAIKNEAGNPINGSGGNLYIEGNFNMYDGTICDGKAVGLYNGDSCMMGIGGNLYATKTSVVKLMGGVMRDGQSSSGGGNIYMAGQVYVGEGMQILGGTADAPTKSGGNINIHEAGRLYIEGGEISGGTATNLGGVISCAGQIIMSGGSVGGGTAGAATSNNIVVLKNAQLTMSGGTVDGAIRQAAGAIVVLKENPVITGTGISSADGTFLTLEGTLGENAQVVVPMEKLICYFAETEIAENTKAFTVAEGYEVLFDSEKNQIYYQSTEVVADHTHAEDGEDVQWTVWDGSAFVDGGHYYLPEGGLNMEGRATVNGIHVTLCLNGQTLTGKAANRTFFILNGGELTICDCSEGETGKIVGQGVNKENGGNIMIGSKSTLNLQGGTIMGGSVKDGMLGGIINIVGNSAGNGVLNMTGGRIVGHNTSVAAGGDVYIAGTLNISGGQIEGLVVPAGGTLSKINISAGAKITGKETNLYLPAGKLINVDGILEETALIGVTLANGSGVFTNTTDLNNAARFQPDNTNFTVNHNGTALELVSGEAGGEEPPVDPEEPTGPDPLPTEPTGHDHCYCDQTLEHEHVQVGWTLWDGDPQKLAAGGCYALENDITLEETIVLGSADQTPQKPVELYLCLNGKTMTAPAGKQVFQIYSGYTLNICDCSEEKTGQIQGNGKVTATGGLIAINKGGSLVQYGGTLTGGQTSNNGGNIAVTAEANFTLYGGKVINGVTTNLGGNLSVSAGAVFTMLGGEISGGTSKAQNANNIIMAAAGTMDLQGGYIKGNIRATNGTVKLSGTIRIADGAGTNLSISKGSIIQIVGPLNGTHQVGVSGSVTIATGVAEDVSAYFFADTAGKSVIYDEVKKELKLA